MLGRPKLVSKKLLPCLIGMKEKVTEMAATVEQMAASTQEISATMTNNTDIAKGAIRLYTNGSRNNGRTTGCNGRNHSFL